MGGCWRPPVGVDGGEGLLAGGVAGLRLLQEDAADDAPRVQPHKVSQRLEEGDVGSQSHQHLRGTGHLLRGLAVARHGHDGPGKGDGGCSRLPLPRAPPRPQTHLVKRVSRWLLRYSAGVTVCSKTVKLGTWLRLRASSASVRCSLSMLGGGHNARWQPPRGPVGSWGRPYNHPAPINSTLSPPPRSGARRGPVLTPPGSCSSPPSPGPALTWWSGSGPSSGSRPPVCPARVPPFWPGV